MCAVARRLENWRVAFEDDQNGVVPTLVNMAWNHAVFMSVAKAVELAPTDADGQKPLNSSVLGLLRTSYWASVILAIRRLIDPGPINGHRGVYSLGSILNDVKALQPRLTRRVYVELIAGLEYDDAEVERQASDYILAHAGNGFVWMPPKLSSAPIAQRHAEFDFLSGVGRDARRPDDLVHPSVFERLEARLRRVHDIGDHGTIYFAHAANQESREGRGIGRLSAKEATDALRLLVETAELIGRWFLCRNVGPVLPTAQFDPLQYLDKPLLRDGDEPALHAQWEAFDKEANRWTQLYDAAL